MIVQRAMSALAIVERLDVIEDLHASLGTAVKATAKNQLEFKGAPEAFHDSVVITIARATHGSDEAGLTEGVTIIGAGVLDTAIRVEQQVMGRSAMQQGHGKGF